MLAALVLAGLTMVALLPFVMDYFDDEDDAVADGGAKLDPSVETLPILNSKTDAVLNDVHDRAAETVMAGFNAAAETATLHTVSWDTELIVASHEDGSSSVSYEGAGGMVGLRFPDLPEPPVEAIEIVVETPGAAPETLALADIVAGAETPVEPLSPTDPDAPDAPPPDAPGNSVLTPGDPEAPDDPSGDPVGDAVLQPEQGPESAGQAGLAASEGAPPVVAGLDRAAELLSAVLAPDAAPEPGEVVITPSADGADGLLVVEGQTVAVLAGAPDAHASDLLLEVLAPATG